ncbi:N-6 DNA methylase [Saccharopolyspora endophytica]|uniref:site-specific DNA-methyltransferase (adenine-specific) n=1 Tax=Saccharopolyspora endophytica TaxID=543886 RepID=A0ABS5DK55_9PSEU|nr:N-6 DNA methylase [Saccharopolyspora endophytica]MBQ0926680.1 SAM-dependent DNA methyltransferase [Saccharopolyspora endophytica]
MTRNTNRQGNHPDPDRHAADIAQSVEVAWNKSNHSGRRDVALSVVSALALLNQRDANTADLAEQLRAQSAEEVARTLREIYTAVINSRPDLTHLVFPLMQWVFNDPEPALKRAAKQVADAALHARQLDLTGTERRYDTDLLGVVLTLLKSDSAGKANAQIYTPMPLADMMARMTPPEEHSSVCDPAVGTGGLLRASAQAMRELDRDPATVAWYGADVDELAIAACAVNSLIWGLGPHIVLCVANTLSEGDWARRAEAQRAEVLQISEQVRRDKLMIHAVRTAQQLTELPIDESQVHE